MSESDNRPPEQKPTPTQEAVDDLLWDIPFARPIWKFFVREGKAVKHGWVAVAVIVVITVYFTHRWTEGDVDAKISAATNYFGGVLAKKESEISELKGELADAKQDRDKYQLMIAPFEAMAIAKYTNAPLDQRLDLLTAAMTAITNVLSGIESSRPTFALLIYDLPTTNGQVIILEKSRELNIGAGNKGDVTAKNVTIDFLTPIAASNIIFYSDWHPEPVAEHPNGIAYNHWIATSELSEGKHDAFIAARITISTNFTEPSFPVSIRIHSDESKTQDYDLTILNQK
jgi:hypothetical protein